MKRIDPTRWNRADLYRHFRSLTSPHASITVEVDVTDRVQQWKQSSRSLFAGMLHELTHAANTVPELRQRIRIEEGEEFVVEHSVVDPAFTVGVDGGGFNMTSVTYQTDALAFDHAVRTASERLRNVTSVTPLETHRDDVFFMSCLPWLRFTSLTHPHSGQVSDSTPRIAWGRMSLDQSRWMVPVNVQVHHALVDGQHLARFFDVLSSG